MDTLKQYSDYLWNYDVGTYLQNPWILGLLTLILIVYGSLAQQELPHFMYVLFDNWFFRLIMFGLIAFIATQSWQVAFVVALIFVLLMHYFNQKKITEAFIDELRRDDHQ